MRKYEIMYIIRPGVEEEAQKALVERFAGVLTNNGAEIINTKEWGKRRLAYEINDLREGFYMILNVNSNAEAINEFGSSPAEDAFAAVEKVRQRAGLNPYALDRGISRDSLRSIIRNERHKEFAFEELRYWDIRRWKIAGNVYNNHPLHGMDITKTADGYIYNISPVLNTAFDETKMYFYPIPYNEMVSNINMRQNPGWQ